MDENKETVTIMQEDYKAYVATATKYNILLDTIFLSAELNWSEDGLCAGENALNAVLRVLEPYEYARTFRELKEVKTERRAE